MQGALNEGRLKFVDRAKSPMQVDFDPLQIKDVNYVKPLERLMVEANESPNVVMEVVESKYVEKVKATYPDVEEKLIDFLNRCKWKGSEVMICARCGDMFDRKAIKGLKKTMPKPSKGGNGPNRGQIIFSTK